MSRRIAIVLARGGSKRLPRKNILDIGGKPMLAWSVRAALDSDCFERVLVSTDDPEIAEVARQHGAEVPFLRTSAADDRSPSSEATRIALFQAETHWRTSYAVVAQFMANCPLRTATDVRAAMKAFESRSAPAQISCFRFGWMNPWWATTLDASGEPRYLFPEARQQRSQDLPALYCPSGALWVARRDAFVVAGNFYAPGHVMEPMDWMSAMDIDDEGDLRMARACMLMRQNA